MSEEFAVTEDFQAKILSHMLHKPDFCEAVVPYVKLEHFSNRALQWFYNKLSNDKTTLSPVTLQEELISAVKGGEIKDVDIDKYVYLYDVIKEKPLPMEETYIEDQMEKFIRTQSVKNAVRKTMDLTKEQKWEDIQALMEEAVNSGLNLSNLGHNYFDNIVNRANERGTRSYVKIPTGIPELDHVTYGGIKKGQTGLIVGGTGRGKSIFLQWLARTALLLNKKVVYFTFELSEEDIADRFDSMFSMVRPQELNYYKNQVINEVSKIGSIYKDSLIIKHFPADGATVYDIKSFIKKLSNTGIIPDMIIIDYLDLMRPHRNYSSQHEETDSVVKAAIGLGQECGISIWTASQLNRAGLVQETPDEASMAGYIGKQYHVDIVTWMAQTREEKEDEIMRLWVSKNRNGLAGSSIQLDTDYSYMTFYRANQTPKPNSVSAVNSNDPKISNN